MKKLGSDNWRYNLNIFVVICILLSLLCTGCIEEKPESIGQTVIVQFEHQVDQISTLPEWIDGDYHDYDATKMKLNDFEETCPDAIDVLSIGKSVEGRDIWCIRLTNEKNNSDKYSCLIDGCIHGCEWEAGESCLYLAEYLLINYGYNATITNILNNTEVYIVPLLNPDGRQKDDRFNNNGIDLNRNFDVHFGRILGRSYRLGKLFGFIKIPHIGKFTNAGRWPFSEPESQSLQDLAKTFDNSRFSFYITCHTAVHCIAGPSELLYRPEFELTSKEKQVIDYVKEWAEENTEYGAYKEEKKRFGYGSSGDWFFKEYSIPTFTFEILSKGYEPWYGQGPHDHLVHWMKTTLPVFMYLLMNIENLNQWKTPDIQPLLPEGVPPLPLGQ